MKKLLFILFLFFSQNCFAEIAINKKLAVEFKEKCGKAYETAPDSQKIWCIKYESEYNIKLLQARIADLELFTEQLGNN